LRFYLVTYSKRVAFLKILIADNPPISSQFQQRIAKCCDVGFAKSGFRPCTVVGYPRVKQVSLILGFVLKLYWDGAS
jgi:hypothetical protein